MGKRTKQIYISDENFELLKAENASELIDRLLAEHFKAKKPKTLDELYKKLAEIRAQKAYESKLKEIEAGHYEKEVNDSNDC